MGTVINPGGSSPAYYDRNPSVQEMQYDGTALAPHAFTTRDTYTCPAGRRAYVEAVSLKIRRVTAGSASGLCAITFDVEPPPKFSVILYSAFLYTDQNTIGDYEATVVGQSFSVAPGHILRLMTFDNSTGGTVFYHGRVRITEFDA